MGYMEALYGSEKQPMAKPTKPTMADVEKVLLDLDAIEGDGRRAGLSPKEKAEILPHDVRFARKREVQRRATQANQRAMRALSKVYPEQYADLHRQAKAKIDQESGPLPGDDLLNES